MIYGKDFLQKRSVSEGYTDENGDFHEGESSWNTDKIQCDAVSNDKAGTISFGDGVARPYSYVVVLDSVCPDFELGEVIQLHTSTETVEKEVLGFRRFQFVARLWV